MSFGHVMALDTHGTREGSKEEGPDEAKVKAREKEKAEEEEDISDLEEPKAEEKEKGEAVLTWWGKKHAKMKI